MERAQVVGPCPEKSFGSHVVPYEGFDVALEGLALFFGGVFRVFGKVLFILGEEHLFPDTFCSISGNVVNLSLR